MKISYRGFKKNLERPKDQNNFLPFFSMYCTVFGTGAIPWDKHSARPCLGG